MDDKVTEKEKAFMEAAFDLAFEALADGEVPVGCVFVYKESVIARGRNTVNATHNATRHAEMNCIDQVLALSPKALVDDNSQPLCKSSQEQRTIFSSIDVYVTVEPCAMCADALCQLRFRKVIFGCSNDRFGGCGSVIDVPSIYKYAGTFKKGLYHERAVQLLKDFYKGVNPHAPMGKAKRKGYR